MNDNYATSFLLQTHSLPNLPEEYLLALVGSVKRLGSRLPNSIPPLFVEFVENFNPRPYDIEVLKGFYTFSKNVPASCKWLSRVENLNALIVDPLVYQLEESGQIVEEFLSRSTLFSS